MLWYIGWFIFEYAFLSHWETLMKGKNNKLIDYIQ